MEGALADFVSLQQSTRSAFEEADWVKVRGLEFREALGRRDELANKLGFLRVEDGEDFDESVSPSMLVV